MRSYFFFTNSLKHIMKITHNTLARMLFVAVSVVAVSPLVTSAATLTRQLEVGMSGSDVSALQTFLASDSSLYPEGLITGYFGALTKAAVIRYQAQKGLPQVGRVGPQTIAMLGDLTGGGWAGNSDRVAPVIGWVNVSTSNNSAALSWNTDQPASAIVYYDTSSLRMTEADSANAVTISGMTNLANTTLTTSHTAQLTNLQSNTTYNYVLYVRDGSGNETVSIPLQFHTN